MILSFAEKGCTIRKTRLNEQTKEMVMTFFAARSPLCWPVYFWLAGLSLSAQMMERSEPLTWPGDRLHLEPFVTKRVFPEMVHGAKDRKKTYVLAHFSKEGRIDRWQWLDLNQTADAGEQKAVDQTLAQWVFEPARHQQEAVSVWMTICLTPSEAPLVVPESFRLPAAKHLIMPTYPAQTEGKRLRKETISLQAMVAEDGTVSLREWIDQERAEEWGFVDTITSALATWQFYPGRLNGQEAPSLMLLSFEFNRGKRDTDPVILQRDVLRVGNFPLIQPVFRQQPSPDFPKEAFIKNVKRAFVVVSALFRVDGVVDDVMVVTPHKDPDMGFERAALLAMTRWVFDPARLGPEPVSFRQEVQLDFTAF
jgi:hypothetical protein